MAAKKKAKKAARKKAPARKTKAAARKKTPAKKSKATGGKKKKTVKAAARPSAAKKKTPAKKASAKKASAKKASAKKKAPASKPARKPAANQVSGEGNYAASRAFLSDQAGFVERNKSQIPELGKQAEAALDGPEGDSLRDAEAAAAGRSRDTFGA